MSAHSNSFSSSANQQATTKKRGSRYVFCIVLAIAFNVNHFALTQQSQPSPQAAASSGGQSTTSQANDPTASLTQVQLQDTYSPNYFGTTGEGNVFILQPVIPTAKRGGVPPIIFRPTIPLVSSPNGRTGLGDIVVVGVGILPVRKTLKLGFGPILEVPSSTNGFAGAGKWQLGPSAVQIYTGIKGLLLGALEENPISFAGESQRADTNELNFQPIIVEELGKRGYFLRFDPTIVFDWEHGGSATVPLNLGFGRTFKLGTQLVNTYIQPEGVVRHPDFAGSASEKFALRFSFTLLYPKKS